MKRTRLKPMSDKRRGQMNIYSEARRKFLQGAPCRIQGCLRPACDLHHVKGRGQFFLDESTWLAVCRVHHDWIHQNPAEARKQWLLA
jgi:hypothetical protein